MSKNSSPPPRRLSRSKKTTAADFVAEIESVARAWVTDTTTAVLGVSGGGDSMALLYAWVESTLPPPVVAHFDHRMRPDSGAAAECVADAAHRLGLTFESGVWSDKPDGPVGEKAARDARYQFLRETAVRRHANVIALAHTKDDQAETVLFRILRGTGVDGLAGIPLFRALQRGLWLVRPLLYSTRNRAREFLQKRGICFQEDATNEDLSRTRNRIRRDLLPKLMQEFNPNVIGALVDLSHSARDYRFLMGAHIEALWNSLAGSASRTEIVIPLKEMESLCSTERTLLLRYLMNRERWPLGRMSVAAWVKMAAVGDVHAPKRWDGPDGISAIRTDTSFVVRQR